MSFTIKCDNCESEDVVVSSYLINYDGDSEVWAICNNCENEEIISKG